jgi:very-short-patch-repair endonuclease
MRAHLSTHRRAKNLRGRLSLPETLLWSRIRPRHPDCHPVRRQHPVGPYILDFYCSALKLGIEIDGYGHLMGDAPEQTGDGPPISADRALS